MPKIATPGKSTNGTSSGRMLLSATTAAKKNAPAQLSRNHRLRGAINGFSAYPQSISS
jgi:hypothetical protein